MNLIFVGGLFVAHCQYSVVVHVNSQDFSERKEPNLLYLVCLEVETVELRTFCYNGLKHIGI